MNFKQNTRVSLSMNLTLIFMLGNIPRNYNSFLNMAVRSTIYEFASLQIHAVCFRSAEHDSGIKKTKRVGNTFFDDILSRV